MRADCVQCGAELLPAYLASPVSGQPPNVYRPVERVHVPRARVLDLQLSWCPQCKLLYAVPK